VGQSNLTNNSDTPPIEYARTVEAAAGKLGWVTSYPWPPLCRPSDTVRIYAVTATPPLPTVPRPSILLGLKLEAEILCLPVSSQVYLAGADAMSLALGSLLISLVGFNASSTTRNSAAQPEALARLDIDHLASTHLGGSGDINCIHNIRPQSVSPPTSGIGKQFSC
jgi:hypothetical protein